MSCHDMSGAAETYCTPWAHVATYDRWHLAIFRTQSECVRTHSGNSQHLNPSNLSPLVCWMVRHGWDWNSSHTTITTPQLLSRGWWKFWLMRSLHFTPSLSVYRLIQPFHISLTHPISHYKYNEWLYKVESGVWALKCTNLAWPKPTFPTQIECVLNDSGNSQHLNPSNLSSLVC